MADPGAENSLDPSRLLNPVEIEARREARSIFAGLG